MIFVPLLTYTCKEGGIKMFEEKLNFKRFLLYFALIFFCIFLISYYIINGLNGKHNLVYNFESGIKDSNVFQLQRCISNNDDEYVNRFAQYVNKHKFYGSSIVETLNEQIEVGYDKNYTYKLTEDTKSISMFHKYKVSIIPYYILIDAGERNTKIYVNKKYVGTFKDKPLRYGPIYPDIYSIKAEGKDIKRELRFNGYTVYSDDVYVQVPLE